jgi:small subunit ribosomal protein S9
MAGQRYTEGTGRRKTSTARVRIISGSGKMTVNDKPAEEYFTRFGDMKSILAPIEAAGLQDKLDITVKVQGGGVTGQTEAVRHGVARALVLMDPELRAAMRTGNFMTRDARAKERKKPGLKRARKAPTYTKR